MNRLATLGFLGAGAALFQPTTAAAQDAPKDDRECLSVELVMFSGRPRPRYVLCEEADKQGALDLLADADEKKPESMAVPAMPSDPTYQGILLTLPRKGDERPVRYLVRKGFLKPIGADAPIRLDSGRKLEKFFLKRSLKEKDGSNSTFKGSKLSDLTDSILEEVEAESNGK